MKRYVEVNLTYSAIHSWPNCDLLEVGYLKFPHRHLFHIKAIKEVSHNERDVEIIMLKTAIEVFLEARFEHNFGYNSCESIAELILTQFDCVEVRVLEDGENGGIVTNYKHENN